MKKLIPVVAASALLLSATSVQAAGTYAFVGVGQAEYDDVSIPSGTGIKVDDNDLTYSFGIGYRFNDNFGLEGGYTDLGDFSASTAGGPVTVTDGADTLTLDGKFSADAAGFFLGVRGMMPLHEKVGVYGRAGFINWESDAKLSGTATLNGVSAAGSYSGEIADGTDPYLGLGIEYKFAKVASVHADWSRYMLDFEGEDIDVDALTLGVTLYY
ncbi:hypothetical protein GCM10009104_02830 [Marinobacterium maritimum]|uniref:Outer membrane protein beta-barrel domain-containing protein n=1 Tax=Marinobacterium maritimum TaxID=500162 RepID=A0ABN1I1T3_9GAMM